MSGVIHGRLSHRWGPTRSSLEAAKKLKSFPEQFGDWKLESSDEMGKDVVEMLQCTGYFSRVYVNRKSGETVNVAVILGPPGQISVHTPEICYSSREFSIMGERKRVAIGNTPSARETFWHVDFQRKNSLQEDQLAVYYAWSTGGLWLASEDPRFQFRRRSLLVQDSTGYPYSVEDGSTDS